MSHRFVIPLREPGLEAADLGFRLYRYGSLLDGGEVDAIVFAQLTDAGDYRVDAPGERGMTATWEYPPGAGASHSWGQDGTPAAVILPIREAGLVAADLGLRIYRNGVELPLTLTVVEVGSPGDYRVSGWGTAGPGEQWLLTWERAGQAFGFAWTGTASTSAAAATGGRGRRFRRLIDRCVRRFGEGLTVTLRRRHSLIDDTDGAPATLVLIGDHAEGSMTVTLGANRLDGRIVPGLQLVVGGVECEVAAETTAAGNRLTAVPLTAPLAVAAADGDDVVVQPYRDYTFRAMVGQGSEQPAGADRAATSTVVLSAVGAPTTPRSDDLLILDSSSDAIQVEAIAPGGASCGWRVRRQERAA